MIMQPGRIDVHYLGLSRFVAVMARCGLALVVEANLPAWNVQDSLNIMDLNRIKQRFYQGRLLVYGILYFIVVS